MDLHFICYLISCILLVLATFEVSSQKINILAAALLFWEVNNLF